jgi:enamine deaminase RidA (YjgF/YER057c/UK114 family)
VNDKERAQGLADTPGYRYAERVGSQLFVAGQVPLDSEGCIVGVGDPAVQARTCLDNLRLLLMVHALGDLDIRQLTVYVSGEHASLVIAWEAVTEWFDGNVPPATLLGVNCLGYQNQLVEIDATVVADAP